MDICNKKHSALITHIKYSENVLLQVCSNNTKTIALSIQKMGCWKMIQLADFLLYFTMG